MWCVLLLLFTWTFVCSCKVTSTVTKSWTTYETRTRVCEQHYLPWSKWWSPWDTPFPQPYPLSLHRKAVYCVKCSKDVYLFLGWVGGGGVWRYDKIGEIVNTDGKKSFLWRHRITPQLGGQLTFCVNERAVNVYDCNQNDAVMLHVLQQNLCEVVSLRLLQFVAPVIAWNKTAN